MVALPVIKLIALGARQVTRPIVKRVVVRATVKQKLTYKVCIALGRLSLGLSSVIAEQSRKEATRQAHALTDAAHHKKASSSSSATAAATTTAATSDASPQGSSSSNNTTAAPADAETRRFMQEALAVASGADVKSPSAAAQYLANARHATTAHGGGGVSGGHGVTLAMATASPASTLPAAAAMASAMPSTMASVEASVVAAAVVNGSGGGNNAAAAEASARTGAEAATVTPRSRSLMQNLFYGPQPYNKADEDDGRRPASPSSSTRGGHDADALLTRGDRRRGEVARLFIFQPYRSSWYVFRKTFFAPFPPQQLLDAGAELLVEVIVFAVLALALMWEIRQQSANTAMKEARTEERMRAFEQKINELVRAQQQLQLLLQDHHHHGDDGHVVEAAHGSSTTATATATAVAAAGRDDAEAAVSATLPTLHSNEVCVATSSSDDSNNDNKQQLHVCSTPRRMRSLSMMVSELPRSEVYVPPGRLSALLQSARSGVVAVADVVTAVGAAATDVVLSAVQSPAHVVTAAMLAPPSTATTTTTARDDDGNKVDDDDAASSDARGEHRAR